MELQMLKTVLIAENQNSVRGITQEDITREDFSCIIYYF
jgi:hypothetical protein